MTISLLAGLSTMIGSLIILIPKFNYKYLTFSLAFSMIIMIGISLFDLIPNAYPLIYERYHYFSLIIIMILLISSYIIIKLINKINIKEKGSLYNLGIISMIVLILHNLPEGIITFLTSYLNKGLGIKLGIAIALHNIPEGITIAMPIYYAKKSRGKALLKTLYASLAEPTGAILAYLLIGKYITNYIIAILFIIVAGLMISLSIEEIVPKINNYYHKKSIITGILVGVIILFISIIIS